LNEVREKMDVGVTIRGEKIDMLHFADDIVVLVENKDELERFLNEMDTVLKENYSRDVNRSKTKVMVCGKNVKETLKMRLRNEELQEVDEFCYLGSKITKDGWSTKEIKSRIAQAKRAFYQKKKLLTSNKISLRTKKKFLKAYVWSVALYGCET
jgi:hypothetical protein